MTSLRISCRSCDETAVVPCSALIVSTGDRPAAEAGNGPARTGIWWICDACADLSFTPIDWPFLLRLVVAGVPVRMADGPARVPAQRLPQHPEHPADGAPFTVDDLIRMHEDLESDTWPQQARWP